MHSRPGGSTADRWAVSEKHVFKDPRGAMNKKWNTFVIFTILLLDSCAPLSNIPITIQSVNTVVTPTITSAPIVQPTQTKTATIIKTPLVQVAIYIPQENEIPVTPIWDYTQASCIGKPYNMWGSPGTFLYKNNNDNLLPIILKPGEGITSLGVSVPGILSPLGTETITTCFGTLQATVIGASSTYSTLTGRLDYIVGEYQRMEWYVCGYGLIKLISSDVGVKNPGNYTFSNIYNLIISSFTPLTTNESHTRYILADIQLGNVAYEYRANIKDEETAEALRRWDAGVRVANSELFERKVIGQHWLIVYFGTEKSVIGKDIILNIDSS